MSEKDRGRRMKTEPWVSLEEIAEAPEGGAQFTDEIPPSDPKRHKNSPFSG
jgi:hypothetical protein